MPSGRRPVTNATTFACLHGAPGRSLGTADLKCRSPFAQLLCEQS